MGADPASRVVPLLELFTSATAVRSATDGINMLIGRLDTPAVSNMHAYSHACIAAVHDRIGTKIGD